MLPEKAIKNQEKQYDNTIPQMNLPNFTSESKPRFLSNIPTQKSTTPNSPEAKKVIKNELKVVIVGNVGAGKSAAINAISELAIKDSGNGLYASEALMEYGVTHIANNKLHIYCTPGQRHLDFMADILCKGAAGIVIMIDKSQANPYEEIAYYLHQHGKFLEAYAGVFAFTHNDDNDTCLSEYQNYIKAHGFSCPVMAVDAREKIDAQRMLMRLLYEISNKNNKKTELVA